MADQNSTPPGVNSDEDTFYTKVKTWYAEKASPTMLPLAGIIALAMIVAIIFIGSFSGDEEVKKNGADATPKLASSESTEPAPGFPEGIETWSQWEAEARPEDRAKLYELRGITAEQTARWAAEETALSKEFVTEIPVGTVIENSGWDGDGWYAVKGYVVKEGDTLFLTDADGIIAVKVSCGNPVSLSAPQKVAEQVKATPTKPKPPTTTGLIPCEPRDSDPNGSRTPHHPGNPTAANPPSPGRTPGAPAPGIAETIVDRQYREPVGGTAPTTYGTPGTGSGGTTPVGQETNPDGSTTVAQPPTAPADNNPPPLDPTVPIAPPPG